MAQVLLAAAPRLPRGSILNEQVKTLALLGAYFEVIEIRHRGQAGEVDVVCENLNPDPFWGNYPGDILVECRNTAVKATLEQVNTFLGQADGGPQ